MRGVRRQPVDWEETFTMHVSNIGLISALRKNFEWIGKKRQPTENGKFVHRNGRPRGLCSLGEFSRSVHQNGEESEQW